ncbi:histone-like nucleoid-structuring protein Lsr2 [Cellulomonas hominis]
MVRKTIVELLDDLDGSAADQTVNFAVDGARYEIDLNAPHAAQLRDALAPYIAAGRRTTGARPAVVPANRRTTVDYAPKAVRAWAASRKIELSSHGRIPTKVLAQYRAAGN